MIPKTRGEGGSGKHELIPSEDDYSLDTNIPVV
jgi:hypothetical protein